MLTVSDYGELITAVDRCRCNILTFEIEHVNVDALEEAERRGVYVEPRAATVAVIQVRGMRRGEDGGTEGMRPWENVRGVREEGLDGWMHQGAATVAVMQVRGVTRGGDGLGGILGRLRMIHWSSAQ